MERGKIIVVEGPSNAGKTTTCQYMKNYENCVVIDECNVYEPNHPRPSKSLEQEIKNQLFFFKVEMRRMRRATQLALEGKNVILDRCGLSIVAIAYAFEKLGKYPTFQHALEQYFKLFKDGEVLIPDEYLFLYTDDKNTRQRNGTRGKKLSEEWIGSDFTKYQNKFYEAAANVIPHSRRISTSGQKKDYVSKIIAGILKVQELSER